MTITTIPVGMLATNCYLLASAEKNCAIIDPGARPDMIMAAVEQKELVPQMILLTHGHYDHIGAVNKLCAAFGIPVYIGAADAEMLRTEPTIAPMLRGADEEFIIDGTTPVREGDSLALDELTISVLDTPGHTRGGVVYICGDALFAGDTLFCGGVGRTDLPGGDTGVLRRSLQKLAALPGDYAVYPGHEESTTLATERRSNPYLWSSGL